MTYPNGDFLNPAAFVKPEHYEPFLMPDSRLVLTPTGQFLCRSHDDKQLLDLQGKPWIGSDVLDDYGRYALKNPSHLDLSLNQHQQKLLHVFSRFPHSVGRVYSSAQDNQGTPTDILHMPLNIDSLPYPYHVGTMMPQRTVPSTAQAFTGKASSPLFPRPIPDQALKRGGLVNHTLSRYAKGGSVYSGPAYQSLQQDLRMQQEKRILMESFAAWFRDRG